MLTSDASNLLNAVFNGVSRLFSIKWPGTTLSIVAIFIGILVTGFVISMIQQFTGFGISIASSSQRGGNNKNIKVSKDRKGDEK